MRAHPGSQTISRVEPRRRRGAGATARARATGKLLLAALIAALAAAFAAQSAAAAAPAAKTCPGFRVLHDDRIGAAVFPAGTYAIKLEDSGLDCKTGGELFARFLEDFDGNLPAPWKVVAEGSGKASFGRGGQAGFSVALTKRQTGGEIEREETTSPDLGTLCRNPFTVNHTTVIRPLRFTKGRFLIYLPAGSTINCEQAVVLFQRFLGASPNLPAPWKLSNQTATFYKPASPVRSAFRIEPLAGAGRR
ncbi:MAG TPA: hypothetical protein VHA80_15295 [Solirubrobacterales bacterium]|nr:hypothetical protein [Solirubrobacterales bacterium]